MHKGAIVTGRFGGYSSTFVIALAASASFFFSFQMLFPVLPRFIAEVVVKQPPDSVAGQVGLAGTVIALVAVLTRIPVGHLADHFGRRRFMLLGAACAGLASLTYIVRPGMPSLLLGRVMHGLGLVLFSTPFLALIADLAPAERRGEALGLAGASSSVAFISAPLVGDWLAAALGYAAFFRVSAATAAVSMSLVAFITAPHSRKAGPADPTAPDAAEPGGSALAGLRSALAQRDVRASALTMAALGITFGAFIAFLPLWVDEQQAGGAGSVFAVYAGTALLAQPLSGWLSDRLGRRGVILPGLVTTSLAMVLLSRAGSLWVFILVGMIYGLGAGLVRGGVDALAQDSVPTTLRGTAVAIQYTSFDFWIGLGSYPLGLLANASGYRVTFVATSLVSLTCSVALAAILWRTPRVPQTRHKG